MHVIHLIIVCIFLGFESLLFRQMGLHAEWVDEPREFALKMLSELSLIISTAASVTLNQKRQRKVNPRDKC